jgi:hypothetical protein
MEEFLFFYGMLKKWPDEDAVPSFARAEYRRIMHRWEHRKDPVK